jgi:hypothetical protein
VADTRISALTRLPEAGVSPTDLLPIADLSASETKAITAKDLLEGVVINMDAGSIPAAKIDFSGGIAPGSIRTTQGDVVLGRISGAGTVEELACTAVGRALLAAADAAGQRTALGLGTLALRSGSWVDGSSFSGTSSGTNTGDQTITLTGDVTGSGTGTFAATIAPGAVSETKLGTGAVSTRALADGGVTAVKLADQSASVVLSGAPTTPGGFVGQGGFNTTTGIAYTYTATGWVQHAGVQSLSVTDSSTPLAVTVTNGSTTGVVIDLDSQAANTVWAGPNGTAGKPAFRKLLGADLPIALATTVGAVMPGSGMSVAADGKLSMAAATASTLGGVIVKGPSLSVAADGSLSHTTSAAAAGSYAKVTTDANGHVIAGAAQLSDADIVSIDASKISSGTLPAARLADGSITARKLADYAIALIQETVPTAGAGAHPIGMTWLQESTGQVSIWNGNSWMKTGASTLFNRNLRYCGTYDPTTGLVTGVTQFGTAEGFKSGDPVPAATDTLAGCYFVASGTGTNASIAGGVAFDAGDWLLCHGSDWVRIDTLSGAGGGGGGGASNLDDLLDVTLTAPKAGDILQFNAAGQWVNVAFTDAGTY